MTSARPASATRKRVRAGEPLEPAPGAPTGSRTVGRPATAGQDEPTEPVRTLAKDGAGPDPRSTRLWRPLSIPLSLRHEHEVPKSPLKTPNSSKLIPKNVSASRLTPKKGEACSVQEYSSFISHFCWCGDESRQRSASLRTDDRRSQHRFKPPEPHPGVLGRSKDRSPDASCSNARWMDVPTSTCCVCVCCTWRELLRQHLAARFAVIKACVICHFLPSVMVGQNMLHDSSSPLLPHLASFL